MTTTSVTSKGQVTIPREIRQKLGIRQGTQVEFVLVRGRAELRVHRIPGTAPESGFGMLKPDKPAVPADFDPASLLKP